MARTLLFGDDHSLSADLAWMWVTSHDWPGWSAEILTAELTSLPVDPATREPHEWLPPHPRRSFAEVGFERCTELAAEMDPRLALSRPSDLVVIGRRGPGLAKALHLGSTADWLLAHPPGPMVMAHRGRTTRRVVVCHDGSVHADRAAAAFAELPWAGATGVTVVTVDDGRTDVDAAFAAATSVLSAAGLDAAQQRLGGDPAHALLRLFEHHPADLVVFGTRGLTGLHRLRAGSTAAVLAHRSDASVLVACADGEDERPPRAD